MNLALFDLDNTLLDTDSDYEWGVFLCEIGAVDVAAFRRDNDKFMADYNRGQLDVHEFLAFQFAPLKKYPRAILEKWHADFMQKKIIPRVLKKGKLKIAEHKNNGDLLILVSATNTFVVAPIARYLGIPNVASTIAAQNEKGDFTGEVRGTPSFQAGKIEAVERFLESQGYFWDYFEKSFFYSDSFNDLPLLSKVTNPCAVNPDAKLLAHAQNHRWQILDFRG